MINMLTKTTFKRLFHEHEKKMQRISQLAKNSLTSYRGAHYELVGFLNIFDTIPGFVVPIFVCCGDEPENPHTFTKPFYFQVINNATNSITCFLKLDNYIEDARARVVKLDSKNYYRERLFYNNTEPLYAFQVSKNDICLGSYLEMQNHFKEFHTEDELLKKEIQEFMNLESSHIWERILIELRHHFPTDSEKDILTKIETLKNSDFADENLKLYILKYEDKVLRVGVCTIDEKKKNYFSTENGKLLEDLLINH